MSDASPAIAQSNHSTATITAAMATLRSLLTRPDDHPADPALNRHAILTSLNTVQAGIVELAARRGVEPVVIDGPTFQIAASAQADREFESGVNPPDDIPFGQAEPAMNPQSAIRNPQSGIDCSPGGMGVPPVCDCSPHDPGDESETPAEKAETLRRLDANEIQRLRTEVDHQRFVLGIIHSFAHTGRECTALDAAVLALHLIELEASYELGKLPR